MAQLLEQLCVYLCMLLHACVHVFGRALLSLECVDALNLDGGYSSGMIFNGRWVGGHWLQNVVARRVANALAIVPNQLSSSV